MGNQQHALKVILALVLAVTLVYGECFPFEKSGSIDGTLSYSELTVKKDSSGHYYMTGYVNNHSGRTLRKVVIKFMSYTSSQRLLWDFNFYIDEIGPGQKYFFNKKVNIYETYRSLGMPIEDTPLQFVVKILSESYLW